MYSLYLSMKSIYQYIMLTLRLERPWRLRYASKCKLSFLKYLWLKQHYSCCLSLHYHFLSCEVAGSEDSNVYFYDLTKPKNTCVNKLQVSFTSMEGINVIIKLKMNKFLLCRVTGFLWWILPGTMEKIYWLHLIFTA